MLILKIFLVLYLKFKFLAGILYFYLQDVTTPVKLGWGEGNQKSRQLG